MFLWSEKKVREQGPRKTTPRGPTSQDLDRPLDRPARPRVGPQRNTADFYDGRKEKKRKDGKKEGGKEKKGGKEKNDVIFFPGDPKNRQSALGAHHSMGGKFCKFPKFPDCLKPQTSSLKSSNLKPVSTLCRGKPRAHVGPGAGLLLSVKAFAGERTRGGSRRAHEEPHERTGAHGEPLGWTPLPLVGMARSARGLWGE